MNKLEFWIASVNHRIVAVSKYHNIAVKQNTVICDASKVRSGDVLSISFFGQIFNYKQD